MAKKFVRGVTGVEDIEKLDKSLTNVNDIISDGQNTYVHTKKGKDELYYNITSGVNQVKSSDGTLTITKDNDTVTIANNTLATKQELATKENTLSVDYGISKTTSGNETKLGIEYTRVPDGYDLNYLQNGRVRAGKFKNSPKDNTWFLVSAFNENMFTIQDAIALTDSNNKTYRRIKMDGIWGSWREQVGDKSVIDNLLSQKQNKLVTNGSIGVTGDGSVQLMTDFQTYTHTNGILKTHSKWIALNTQPDAKVYEEAHFMVKINKGAESVTFTINDYDKDKFGFIINTYGQNGSVSINGYVLTLSGSSLTVTTPNNVNNNYVVTFSDILR